MSKSIVLFNGKDFDIQQLGTILAQSGFFSDTKSAAQAITKILAGHELNFGPIASMTGVYIVKGRVSLSANMMLATILNTKRYRHKPLEISNTKVSIKFERFDDYNRTWEEIGISTFTMEDAKIAGLLNSQNYKLYPRNMLFARAVSNGARWFCPDAFCGHTPYTPDEIDDRARITEEGDYTLPVTHQIESTPVVVTPEKASEEQLDELDSLIEKLNIAEEKVLGHYGVGSLEELSSDSAQAAILLLRSRLTSNK